MHDSIHEWRRRKKERKLRDSIHYNSMEKRIRMQYDGDKFGIGAWYNDNLHIAH